MHRSTPTALSVHLQPLVRLAAVGLLAVAATWAGAQQQPPIQPTGNYNPNISPNPDKPIVSPVANPVPDANARMVMDQQQTKKDKFEAANALRRKQISDDVAKLLELATELKSAVDKTDKDTLSLDIMRKADTIERLAKGVKDKMKLTVGAS